MIDILFFFFFFFFQKTATFLAHFLLRKQFALNVKSDFSGKKKIEKYSECLLVFLFIIQS